MTRQSLLLMNLNWWMSATCVEHLHCPTIFYSVEMFFFAFNHKDVYNLVKSVRLPSVMRAQM